jgi:hypothetical protein
MMVGDVKIKVTKTKTKATSKRHKHLSRINWETLANRETTIAIKAASSQ